MNHDSSSLQVHKFVPASASSLATASIFFFRLGWEWTSHSVAPFTKWTNHSWKKRNKQFPFDWIVHLSVCFTRKANILFPLFQISGFQNQWWLGVGRACFCPYGFLYTMGEFKKQKKTDPPLPNDSYKLELNFPSALCVDREVSRRAKPFSSLNSVWTYFDSGVLQRKEPAAINQHSNPRPRPLCSLLKWGQVGKIVLGVTERLWSL